MNHRMTLLVNGLKEHASLLEAEIRRLKLALEDAPEGRLRINKQRGKARYYLRSNSSDRCGEYTSDNLLIKNLAQKSYNEFLLKELTKNLIAIKAALKSCEHDSYDLALSSASGLRQQLIVPSKLEPTDDDIVNNFIAKSYTTKGFKLTDKEYYSTLGIRARSKSESQIMNCLDNASVPYRYEEEITLGGKILHPDFTVINKRTHAQYFWEHCGMMDDPKYTSELVRRMNLYNKYGLYLGKNLILTFETLETPLNAVAINKVIKTYLL